MEKIGYHELLRINLRLLFVAFWVKKVKMSTEFVYRGSRVLSGGSKNGRVWATKKEEEFMKRF